MAAYFESGFLVDRPAWHGLGNVIQKAPTIEEGIKLAGLDWEVGYKPIQTTDGVDLSEFARATYRMTDGKVLGAIGNRTHVLQNQEAFEFFNPWIESGEAELHTAGSLHGGRIVWILAKLNLPNATIIPGDEVQKYVLLSNAHDGSAAVRTGFTPIRTVCANTLAQAHSHRQSKLIRIRHSKKVKENVDAIRDTMNLINQEFEATMEQFCFLAKKKINRNDLKRYVKIVLNGKDIDDEEVSTRLKNTIDKVIHLYDHGLGSGIQNVRGSYWGAYNAVTEYLNYERGHTAESRLKSLWFGDSANMNQFALDAALQLAG